MEQLEEIKELILLFIRGVWKNRWIAIIVAWPLLIGGVLFVDRMSDRYTAETKVYIDTTSVLKPLLKGLAIQSDFEANVRLMVRKLLSRPNLERAARLMDMDIEISSPQEMELLIERLRNRIDISAKRRTSTYSISYTDTDRDRAKQMVQTLLDIFIEDTLGQSVSESDSAISFLDDQIAKYEKLLQEAEERREAFKRKNVGLMPQDGGNYYQQLQEVSVQLERAELQLSEAVNRRNKIKTQVDELLKPVETARKTTSSYDERIKDQETRLEDLLLLYTEEHPDVINARLILDSLYKRRDQELENDSGSASSRPTENVVYQELKILLTQTEADISSLSTRVSSFRSKQQQLKELVDIVPRIEAELQRLNRDYNVHKENYTTLVQRREQARISEDVESGTEQVKFRIIEPPYVPTKPSFPNRPLFDMAVLVLALIAGYGLSLLISLFQPVFYNPADLKKSFDLPILGAVSKFDTEEVLSKRKRNVYFFALTNTLLLCAGLAFMFVHKQGYLILEVISNTGVMR